MATATVEKKVSSKSTTVSSPLDRPYLITVDRYMRMVNTGVFSSKEPIYLWKGTLVEKMTKGDFHSFALSKLDWLLNRLLPDGWHVRPEQPIILGTYGMPEPDLLILRGMHENYLNRPPVPRDVCLLIEVADSTLAADRGEVLRAYAEHKIEAYWIVNIPGRAIEVHTKPFGKGDKARYRDVRAFKADENVPVIIDGREIGAIKVKDVLP